MEFNFNVFDFILVEEMINIWDCFRNHLSVIISSCLKNSENFIRVAHQQVTHQQDRKWLCYNRLLTDVVLIHMTGVFSLLNINGLKVM